MFGGHFYHATMRKSVAIFGTLFNDMHIVRKDGSGGVLSQQKVPLAYGPKQKFLARLDQNTGTDATLAIKLPRMAFEITSLSVNNNDKLQKLNKIVENSSSDVTKKKTIDFFTNYDIGMSLHIMAKNQDDGLQIVEQILPFFQPEYTVSIKPIDNFNFKQDVPITLTSVSFSDEYEGDFVTRRVLTYQLDFTMKMRFYGPSDGNTNIIREINVDFEKFGTANDTNRFEEMDFTIGATDTPDDFTVTTTIDETPEVD
tara:strand:+ start:2614 stop:3381 length:768 start_codon:yes stop_codon:yes gene_type:complete